MRPVVASYCTTFLKREMRHIYRQVTGLRRFQTFVMAKERACAEEYPFEDIEMIPRPPGNFVRRFYLKYVKRAEPIFYRGEYQMLEGILARRETSVLHVYFGHTGVHLLPFLRNWPGASLVSFHGADVTLRERQPEYERQLRSLLKTVPLVLARSESLAARLRALGCPPERIRLNRTSIPTEEFPIVDHQVPADGRWVVLQACRLIEKKGLPTSLRAFARLRGEFPNARFVLVGEGPLEATLRSQVAELGIGDAVTFTGFCNQDELRRLFAEAHIFLHPSETTSTLDQEGVPNAMLEAMSTGLPVVATRHGGIPEAVTDGVDGILCGEREPDAVAEALTTLVRESAKREKMGRAAAASVRAKFAIEAQIGQLESCYDELLALGKGDGSAT